MMSEVNGVFGNVRECFVSLGYCAFVQKLAPWTADAGGVLGHHPHGLHSVGDLALDTLKGAEKCAGKMVGTGWKQRECVYSQKNLGMERGNLENRGSLKEGRATARQILFIAIDVVVIIIYVTVRH